RETRGVAFNVAAGGAAEKLPDGDAERFALDVPERHVYRALGVQLLAAGRVEIASIIDLPQMIDAQWILADDHLRALLDGVLRAALADANDPGVGFDSDDVGALVKERLGERIVIEANPRDFHFWEGGQQPSRASERGGCGGDRRLKE